MKKLYLPQQQQITTQRISRLLNSIHYFLDCVFIFPWEEGYRLSIIHNEKSIMDANYKTLRGAKIAFAKFFGDKAWRQDLQPHWSIQYSPEQGWLSKKMKILKKFNPEID